jgi:hypothetical protein
MNRLLSTGKIVLLASFVATVSALTLGQGVRQNPALSNDVNKFRDELIKQDTRMHDILPRGFEEPYRSWTDGYTEINEAGELLSKAEVRARYRAAANRRPNIPSEDYAVRIHRDTIIMTHVLKRKGLKNDEGGYPVIPTIYSFRVSHVFVKRDGQWQMTSTQWTPIVETRTGEQNRELCYGPNRPLYSGE